MLRLTIENSVSISAPVHIHKTNPLTEGILNEETRLQTFRFELHVDQKTQYLVSPIDPVSRKGFPRNWLAWKGLRNRPRNAGVPRQGKKGRQNANLARPLLKCFFDPKELQ